MVGRRTRSKKPRSPGGMSPNNRKKRNRDNQAEKQESIASIRKDLFNRSTNSPAKDPEDDDDDVSVNSSSAEFSENSSNEEEEKQSTETSFAYDNNDNSNTSTEIIILNDDDNQKIDLAELRPPEIWKYSIASATNQWNSLDPNMTKDLQPFTTQELLGEYDDDKTSLKMQLEEGKEMIATDLHNAHPTVDNWLQVILNVFADDSPELVHYTALRITFIRLALTDPVALFPATQWFNNGLSMIYEGHAAWIAAYIEFGAPWKTRDHWIEITKPSQLKAPPKTTPSDTLQNKKTKKKTTKETVKFNVPSAKPPTPNPVVPSTGNHLFLNKPLIVNPYKTKKIAKMKDYSRHHRTYVKIKLARITSENFSDQEIELTTSLKQLLHYIWTTDNTALILPWSKSSLNTPLKKGSELPKTKFDMDKYVDRIWMQKNQSAYCRMIVAHNPDPRKLFEDPQLQQCIEKSQLMLNVERIQADKLVSAGHLLGYHTTVCNCANLSDALQQHPVLQGLQIEVRPEFISFGKKNGSKQVDRSKTKILQVYVAWDSSGKARRALLQIYSSTMKGQYPLGVVARFVPNVEDYRFIHTTAGRLAYTNSLKKHIKFMEMTEIISTPNIIELDAIIPRYQTSLRQIIMHIFSASNSQWNLFVAVDTSYFGDVLFAYRQELANEAKNMITALPLFLEATLGHSDVWKWFTAQARDEAQDHKWDLQKGLVSKYAETSTIQLDKWEHLDDFEDAADDTESNVLQPFKLDLSHFGSNAYRDDGTIQTHHLLSASAKDPLVIDQEQDDHSMGESHSPSQDLGFSSVTTTEVGTTITPSTITATPENSMLLEYRNHPLIMQAMAAIQLNSQASAKTSDEMSAPAK